MIIICRLEKRPEHDLKKKMTEGLDMRLLVLSLQLGTLKLHAVSFIGS